MATIIVVIILKAHKTVQNGFVLGLEFTSKTSIGWPTGCWGLILELTFLFSIILPKGSW